MKHLNDLSSIQVILTALFVVAIAVAVNLIRARRDFYSNPEGQRAKIKYNNIKVTVQSHYKGNLYNVVSDNGRYSYIDINDLRPIYFNL